MGHWEDFFWEVAEEVNQLGLRKEFDKLLHQIRNDENYRYTDIKDRWFIALTKLKEQNNIKDERI